LVLHALCAMALVGSVTHNAVLATLHLRGRLVRVGLSKTYARIVALLFPLTLLIGALAYPSYRVHAQGILPRRYNWKSQMHLAW